MPIIETFVQADPKIIEIKISDYISDTHITDECVKPPADRAADIDNIIGKADLANDIADGIQNNIKQIRDSLQTYGPSQVILDFKGVESVTPYFINRLTRVGNATRSNFIVVNADKKVLEIFKNMDTEAFRFAGSAAEAHKLSSQIEMS